MPLNNELLKDVYKRCQQTGAWYGVEITQFEQRNFMEDTVLHTVCSWGELNPVEILVNAGANVNAKGDQGATPLFNSVIGGSPEVVAFLLKSGADVNIPNEYRRLVLDYARNVSASSSIVKMLEDASKRKNRG